MNDDGSRRECAPREPGGGRREIEKLLMLHAPADVVVVRGSAITPPVHSRTSMTCPLTAKGTYWDHRIMLRYLGSRVKPSATRQVAGVSSSQAPYDKPVLDVQAAILRGQLRDQSVDG